MNEKKRSQKARIGSKIAKVVEASKQSIPTTQLSNWRNGWSLPRLEQFLEICQNAQITDLQIFTNDETNVKNLQETC